MEMLDTHHTLMLGLAAMFCSAALRQMAPAAAQEHAAVGTAANNPKKQRRLCCKGLINEGSNPCGMQQQADAGRLPHVVADPPKLPDGCSPIWPHWQWLT
jgi:hypothetical protein